MRCLCAGTFLAVGLLAAGTALGDIVYLNNGGEIEGQIIQNYPSHVVILVGGRQISVRKQDIDTIQMQTVAAKPAAAPKPEPARPADAKPGEARGESKPADAAKTVPADRRTAEGGAPGAGKTEAGKEPAAEKRKETGGLGWGTDEEAGKEGEAPLTEEEDKEEMDKVKIGAWPKADPAKEAEINDLMEKAGKASPSKLGDLKAIRSQLVAFGADAVPYLAKNLTHQDVKVRTICADTLGELASSDAGAARMALRHMIMVMTADGVMPAPGTVLAWYQRDFVQSLARALAKPTGIVGVACNSKSPAIGDEMKQFLGWWESNRRKIEEPQLGEPYIEKSDALYKKKMEKIYKLREIKSEDRLKLAFSAPDGSTPVEVATGRKQNPNDSRIERSGDKSFAGSIPKVKQEDAGGLVRDKDKQSVKDFFR